MTQLALDIETDTRLVLASVKVEIESDDCYRGLEDIIGGSAVFDKKTGAIDREETYNAYLREYREACRNNNTAFVTWGKTAKQWAEQCTNQDVRMYENLVSGYTQVVGIVVTADVLYPSPFGRRTEKFQESVWGFTCSGREDFPYLREEAKEIGSELKGQIEQHGIDTTYFDTMLAKAIDDTF